MQKAVREMQGAERQAANKVREALGDMQGSELKNRAKMLADWYRRGYGQYVQGRENSLSNGLEHLRDQLAEARSALGPGRDPNQGKLEEALSQVEKLRQQLDQLARNAQSGRRGQPSQQGQQGQQGQPGQQAQQGQAGSQGQAQGDGTTGDRYDANGSIRPGIPQPVGPSDRAAVERAVQDGIRDLSRLRQSLADNPDVNKQLQDVLRSLQRFGGSGDLHVIDAMRNDVLPQVEQLETQLRRKLDEQSGQVRASSNEPVPQGYGDAIAEYFRRLSRAK